MRTPIRTVGAFGGSTEPAVLPGRTCLKYGPFRTIAFSLAQIRSAFLRAVRLTQSR